MPLSDLHKKKRKKNFTILAILCAFIATVWAITMIKMGLQ